MRRIGFLGQNQTPTSQPNHYSNALDDLKMPATKGAEFDLKIERPQTTDVLATDRYNCQAMEKLITTLREKVEAVLSKSLPETEKIVAIKPEASTNELHKIAKNLLTSATELTALGDLATDLLRNIDKLFIEPPANDPTKKSHENSRMNMIGYSARTLLRDYGRETDYVASQMRDLTLNLAADRDSQYKISVKSLIGTQLAAFTLINAQRNLQRFVLALDGPIGFRTIAAEGDKPAAA